MNLNQSLICDLNDGAAKMDLLARKLKNRKPEMVHHVDLLRSVARTLEQIAKEVNAS
jgi:hypothetical protein